LNAEQISHLKERIEKSKGVIRMFMHPFYDKSYAFKSANNEQTPDSMRQGLKRLVRLPEEKTPPIFIFEEEENYLNLLEKLLADLNQDIYIIPTHRDSGRLSLKSHDDVVKYLSNIYESNKRNYQILADKLADVGTKEILLGGMSLLIYKNEHPEDTLVKGCVSSPLRLLSTRFPITISHFTHPDKNEFIEIFDRKIYPEDNYLWQGNTH
jgi:hypothetical protein